MVVEQSNIDHIMRGLQSAEGVRLHNHRKKLRQRFDIIKKLGQGTYGKVQLGINKETGQEVAIKAIKKCKIETEADLVRIRREIQIMSSVRHPNIIHIYEVFENREKMVLVMEYAAGGELYDFLSERKVLEETEARRIFRQISTAVYYCHKHKICHRDLKLENILLDQQGNAKIADFGLSNVYDEQHLLNSFCGSPLYASPEIVKGTPYYGPEVDCWSLGVLLYTLVYGAMPFDGSNFKRLVKQISQAVYFEPENPSSASPLIREMLTVNPKNRATIEQICSHWWVNQGFNVSCLDIAEDLANQTPVRLDLLLSLAPPPENSEKLVVTDSQSATSQDTPARSLSVGSFMELDPNTEQRIRDFVAQEVPWDSNEKTVKRKLEADASESSVKKEGARKKERTKLSEQLKETELLENEGKSANKENNNNNNNNNNNHIVMDIDKKSNKISSKEEELPTDISAKNEPLETSEETEKISTEAKMDLIEPNTKSVEVEKFSDSASKEKPAKKSIKVVKKKVLKDADGENKDNETKDSKIKVKKKKNNEDLEAIKDTEKESNKTERKSEVEENENVGKEIKREGAMRKSASAVKTVSKEDKEKVQSIDHSDESTPAKLPERRKSKIFETAEKFMANDSKSPSQEKPKKMFIPGVKVSDFAKAFERRSSLTNVPTPKTSTSRKSISKEAEKKVDDKAKECTEIRKECENSSQTSDNLTEAKASSKTDSTSASPEQKEGSAEETQLENSDEKLKNLKDLARNIISSALVEEERKKIKKQILKPPAAKTKIDDSENKRPLTLQLGKETATVHIHSPENTKFLFDPQAESSGENKENVEGSKEKKTTKMEIKLKSNTLPRGAGSKTEGRLKTPPAQGTEKSPNFRTEVEHRVGDPHARFTTQRSEVTFPVSAAQRPIRSMSLEPEIRRPQSQTKERIIPIQLEGRDHKEENEARDRVRDLADRITEAKPKPYQRTLSQRSASLSRQSTQDSDIECPTAPGEAIKKSPREFIIPIAVEGGGYVTPRATSLEPSDNNTSKRGIRPFSRKIGLWSDNGSEDESAFSTLQRHPSRDFNEPFRLHRLRSSRPMRASFEKADSASGSEEEEDDDGFEILTAENLFSTLLSRVRSLTQRLNVEGGLRPGFPSSRLMNHFGPSERLLSNFHQPLRTRISERPDFARSLSRDIENGLNRWNRADLSNSDSARSLSRGKWLLNTLEDSFANDNFRNKSKKLNRPDSKSRRSESDTESITESNRSSSRKKIKEQGQKTSKKSSSQMKAKASSNQSDSENVCDSFFKSTIPDNKPNLRVYQKQISDSEFVDPLHTCTPLLHRTASLKSDRIRNQSERKSIGICEELTANGDKARNFYDILAEKYGIKKGKRYDLIPSQSRDSNKQSENAFDSVLAQSAVEARNPENSIAEVNIVDKIPYDKQTDVLPPIPPKVRKEDGEKCKTPSEKLADVLNRLEGAKKVKAEKKGNSSLFENVQPQTRSNDFEQTQATIKNRLECLSPEALELYEKTLAFYEKKDTKETVREATGKPARSGIPRKIPTKHMPEVMPREVEKRSERKMANRETPEKSVLCKYLRDPTASSQPKFEGNQKNVSVDGDCVQEKKLRRCDSLRSRLSEPKEKANGNGEEIKVDAVATLPRRKTVKEAEASDGKSGGMDDAAKKFPKDAGTSKTGDKEERQKPGRSKLFTSLEKRFEKFCGDKKYVDKAIRSLRESSLGPKDVSSENVLIKRAVSMSDCSQTKTVQKGKIQSRVNSVLGMFKKIENSEVVANSAPDAFQEESKIPQRKRPSLKIDLTGDDKLKDKLETARRASNVAHNDLSPNRSPSSLPGFDDSSSVKSPDSESYDSWSNCSDVYSPDDFSCRSSSRHSASNFDEMSTESVSERIRRKSFYSRFNERRKPRRISVLESWKKYDAEEGSSYSRLSENNSSVGGDASRKYEEGRVKLSEEETFPYRKFSLDLSRDAKRHSFNRGNSQSSIASSYASLSRSYRDGNGGSRMGRTSDSCYRTGSSTLERALSPTRPFSPSRGLSPSCARGSNPSFE